jgi:hypothetical protein
MAPSAVQGRRRRGHDEAVAGGPRHHDLGRAGGGRHACWVQIAADQSGDHRRIRRIVVRRARRHPEAHRRHYRRSRLAVRRRQSRQHGASAGCCRVADPHGAGSRRPAARAARPHRRCGHGIPRARAGAGSRRARRRPRRRRLDVSVALDARRHRPGPGLCHDAAGPRQTTRHRRHRCRRDGRCAPRRGPAAAGERTFLRPPRDRRT